MVDEVGFAPLDDIGTQLLFRFVAAASERRSLVTRHSSYRIQGATSLVKMPSEQPISGGHRNLLRQTGTRSDLGRSASLGLGGQVAGVGGPQTAVNIASAAWVRLNAIVARTDHAPLAEKSPEGSSASWRCSRTTSTR